MNGLVQNNTITWMLVFCTAVRLDFVIV